MSEPEPEARPKRRRFSPATEQMGGKSNARVVIFVFALIAFWIYFADDPWLPWLFPLFFVGLTIAVILFAYRKFVWQLLVSLVKLRRLPAIIWKSESGAWKIRCPKCHADVLLEPGEETKWRFQCSACGTNGTTNLNLES